MEKLILRREYDPFMKMWKYLAVFPEERANIGRICCVAFYFNCYNQVVFEPFCEADLGYYYKKTKRIKAKSDEAEKCKTALEKYYNTTFRLMEKIA